MNANIISNAATFNIHPADIRSFEWNGAKYEGPDGLSLWIGWSSGGWGNGPYRYSIEVASSRPATEVIREAGPHAHRNETDVTRSFRPLTRVDVDDPRIWNAACRAVTDHFHHFTVEREKKDRRRIEDRLRKDRAFLRAVIEMERKLQEDEY